MFIDPGCQPEDAAVAGIAVVQHIVSADTGNAGGIVSPEASTDPELMLNRRVLVEQCIPARNGRVQRVALSAIDAVGEQAHDDLASSLQRHAPSVGMACGMVDAHNVARRLHCEEAQRLSSPADLERSGKAVRTALCWVPLR